MENIHQIFHLSEATFQQPQQQAHTKTHFSQIYGQNINKIGKKHKYNYTFSK
jgi:hypothetical protein